MISKRPHIHQFQGCDLICTNTLFVVENSQENLLFLLNLMHANNVTKVTLINLKSVILTKKDV